MSAALAVLELTAPTFPSSSRYRVGRAFADGPRGPAYFGFQRGAAGFERIVVIARAPRHSRDALVAELTRTVGFRHANLVGIEDVEEHGGELYLVSEYVEGASLASLVDLATKRQIPPSIALRIGRDVRSALMSLHDAGFVHRHVSAGNVLVGSDGVARITDFGLPEAAAMKRGPRAVPTSRDDIAAFSRMLEAIGVSLSELESAKVASVASHEEVADFVEQVARESLDDQRTEIRKNAFFADDYEEVSEVRTRIFAAPPEPVETKMQTQMLDIPRPVEVPSIKADIAKLGLALFLVAALCLTTAFACGAFFR